MRWPPNIFCGGQMVCSRTTILIFYVVAVLVAVSLSEPIRIPIQLKQETGEIPVEDIPVNNNFTRNYTLGIVPSGIEIPYPKQEDHQVTTFVPLGQRRRNMIVGRVAVGKLFKGRCPYKVCYNGRRRQRRKYLDVVFDTMTPSTWFFGDNRDIRSQLQKALPRYTSHTLVNKFYNPLQSPMSMYWQKEKFGGSTAGRGGKTAFSQAYPDGNFFAGSFGRDTIELGAIDIVQADFGVVHKMNVLAQRSAIEYDGIIGLSLLEEYADKRIPFFESLMKWRQVEQKVFAIHLTHREDSGLTGEIIFGGYDKTKKAYTGSFIDCRLDKIGNEKEPEFWSFLLSGIKLGSTTVLTDRKAPAVMDIRSEFNHVPREVIAAIQKKLKTKVGAKYAMDWKTEEFTQGAVWDPNDVVMECRYRYKLKMDELKFMYGGVRSPIKFDEFEYFIPMEGDRYGKMCVLDLKPLPQGYPAQVILGLPVLKKYYTVFDYSSKRLRFAESTSKTKFTDRDKGRFSPPAGGVWGNAGVGGGGASTRGGGGSSDSSDSSSEDYRGGYWNSNPYDADYYYNPNRIRGNGDDDGFYRRRDQQKRKKSSGSRGGGGGGRKRAVVSLTSSQIPLPYSIHMAGNETVVLPSLEEQEAAAGGGEPNMMMLEEENYSSSS